MHENLTGIAAVGQLEQPILAFARASRMPSVLDAVVIGPALAERASSAADGRQVSEVGVHSVGDGGVGDGDVDRLESDHQEVSSAARRIAVDLCNLSWTYPGCTKPWFCSLEPVDALQGKYP